MMNDDVWALKLIISQRMPKSSSFSPPFSFSLHLLNDEKNPLELTKLVLQTKLTKTAAYISRQLLFRSKLSELAALLNS